MSADIQAPVSRPKRAARAPASNERRPVRRKFLASIRPPAESVSHLDSMKLRHHRATWHTWRDALARCYDQKNANDPNYGGRGIGVHPAWKDNRAFVKSMGFRPEGLTLGRIDNDGDYEPGNCEWQTVAEQNQNRRSSKLNAQDVLDIKAAIVAGERRQDIPDRYGISIRHVHAIKAGRKWKCIEAKTQAFPPVYTIIVE